MACFSNTRFKTVRQVEVLNRGRKMNVRTRDDRPKKKKYKPQSAASKERHSASELARRRAMRRLRALYPEMYAVLYAQERAKAGLTPVPGSLMSFEDVVTTYEGSIAYSEDNGFQLP